MAQHAHNPNASVCFCEACRLGVRFHESQQRSHNPEGFCFCELCVKRENERWRNRGDDD